MIFHLSFPHRPFLYKFIEPFEKNFPGNNKVLLLTDSINENYYCEVPDELILYKGNSKEEIIDIINGTANIGVCVYWLNDGIINIVKKINPNIRIYFRSYGPDIKPLLYYKKVILKKETRKLIETQYLTFLKQFMRSLKSIISAGNIRKQNGINDLKTFLLRVNALGTVTNQEYIQLKTLLPELTEKRFTLRMYDNSLEQPFPNKNKYKIIIGHSGYAINNHVDIYKELSKFKLSDSYQVYSILSYGNKEYIEKVISAGHKFLKHNFVPITSYQPMEQYYNMIDECNVLILNNIIQQGGGNVGRFLMNGGKVYLDENNPIYIDRKNDGYVIFSVQKDLTLEHLTERQLTLEEKIKNRELMRSNIRIDEDIIELTKFLSDYRALHHKITALK